MEITIEYKYTARGLITENYIEEETRRWSIDDAVNVVSVCIRHMRKNRGGLHITVSGKTLSFYDKNLDDWSNGVVCYCESEPYNKSVEKIYLSMA